MTRFNPESMKFLAAADNGGSGAASANGTNGNGGSSTAQTAADLEAQVAEAQQTILSLQNQLNDVSTALPSVAPQTIMSSFAAFLPEDIVSNVTQRVTNGMWTGGTGSLQTFFTSSTQSGSSGEYFYHIYNANPAVDTTAEIQFDVTYGHRTGLGAQSIANNNNSKLETQAVYAQFRNILLEANDTQFTFGNNVDSDDIYGITIRRSRLKQKMDAGNWELTLSGSLGKVTLIDDSALKFDQNTSRGGRIYNVVSGALNLAAGSSSIHLAAASEPSGGYGLFYPDLGIVILNPATVQTRIGLTAATGSTVKADNAGRFFDAIKLGGQFTARSEEIVTSTHYFVRAKNRDFNFSNNPTFYTSSDAKIRHTTFINDPSVYITTVGLYNSFNELIAVAKLSQPLLKTFDREALIKVKLDF